MLTFSAVGIQDKINENLYSLEDLRMQRARGSRMGALKPQEQALKEKGGAATLSSETCLDGLKSFQLRSGRCGEIESHGP